MTPPTPTPAPVTTSQASPRYAECPRDGEPLDKRPGVITLAECPECDYVVAQTYTTNTIDETVGKALTRVRSD